MGQNLILNINDHGFVVRSPSWLAYFRVPYSNWVLRFAQVVAFNRTVEKVDQFLLNEAKGTKIVGAHSIEDLVKKLKKPRRVMVRISALSHNFAFFST